MNKQVPIFFSVDDNYAPFLAVALNSAIKNADKTRKYQANILYKDLNKQNISKIKALETDNFSINMFPMENSFQMLDDRMSNRLRCDFFTLTIFFRLFIPDLFSQYDKGMYIDCDVALTEDIGKLFDIDLGDNLIGACRDLSIADIPPLVAYTENAVGIKRGEYVNSGVLLMNLKKMRELKFEEHFLNLHKTYQFENLAPDQDYLNAICSGKILYLENEWNTMPNKARPVSKSPRLIHYNLFEKPWCYDGIQYEDVFWSYAEDSGFIDEIRAYKAAYSDEKKESDRKCLELMVKKSTEIPDLDVTFKKMSEKGVKIRL